MISRAIIILGLVSAGVSVSRAESEGASAPLSSRYPYLACSVLASAVEANLPEGVLLRAGGLEITLKELQQDLVRAPAHLQKQLKQHAFFHLEQYAARKLLLAAARKDAARLGLDLIGRTDDEILKAYLGKVAGDVQVTDAEISAFYEANSDLVGNAPLSQVKGELRQYLLQEKQQAAMDDYIKSLGRRMAVTVSSKWLSEQARTARDNPVGKVRSSGIPSLVDFGSTGCRPCDMMTPVLANLTQKYAGRLNVLFVHVGQEQILAAMYGIQSIPVQIIFDKDGKELWRHTGFWPQSEIEKKLEDLGIK
jgi:thioredoxin 1